MSPTGKTASEIVALVRTEEVTPHNLVDALEQRITRVDCAVNALPTLCIERARKHASALMKKPGHHRTVSLRTLT